jgi:hypothetical protein
LTFTLDSAAALSDSVIISRLYSVSPLFPAVFITIAEPITVTRSPACGNSQCETGERCTDASCATGCRADCPFSVSDCASETETPCSSRGVCRPADNACDCFRGYAGAQCTVCSVGYTRGPSGTCVLTDAIGVSCFNGVRDGNETGIDCGGQCDTACGAGILSTSSVPLSPVTMAGIIVAGVVVLALLGVGGYRVKQRRQARKNGVVNKNKVVPQAASPTKPHHGPATAGDDARPEFTDNEDDGDDDNDGDDSAPVNATPFEAVEAKADVGDESKPVMCGGFASTLPQQDDDPVRAMLAAASEGSASVQSSTPGQSMPASPERDHTDVAPPSADSSNTRPTGELPQAEASFVRVRRNSLTGPGGVRRKSITQSAGSLIAAAVALEADGPADFCATPPQPKQSGDPRDATPVSELAEGALQQSPTKRRDSTKKRRLTPLMSVKPDGFPMFHGGSVVPEPAPAEGAEGTRHPFQPPPEKKSPTALRKKLMDSK